MKKLVIAVSGPPGSGKSTFSKILAEKFNLKIISAGKIFRDLANKMGKNLEEFHKLAEKNYELDKFVDSISIEEAKKGNVIIEGHLACWILKNLADLKIYLNAPLKVRIKRISERDNKSYNQVKKEILERERSNKKRFKEIYGIDVNDFSCIDLMINTALLNKNEISEILISFINAYLFHRNVSFNNNRKTLC